MQANRFEGFAGKPYNPGIEEQQELLGFLEKAAQLPGMIPDWRVLYMWFAQGRRCGQALCTATCILIKACLDEIITTSALVLSALNRS